VLASLLQLNRAERALLLYGTLARYQRDLRSLLVEFKVSNAPEAYAAIADVAGVKAPEVAEALRPGSRLERIGMVENLISEHNITDLADLMKVSERLPPVLMRKYRDRSELMAVFTRPAPRSSLGLADFAFVQDDAQVLVALLRQAVANKEPGVNVLLYGPPGTGKTELAEHIAQALEQPLLIKQASDLMSKYVGETEQQMAAMFREAEAEKAVLLLDEADSFLRDRRGAQRSYEVTEVNEMLQGMERYNGIFICTTNLLDSLDQAALRRFTFKIKFMPLTGAQREAMFVTEALAGDVSLLTASLQKALAPLTQLCPGDFAAVKRQGVILEAELSAEEFLAQLEAEHRIKPEVREGRAMGFMR